MKQPVINIATFVLDDNEMVLKLIDQAFKRVGILNYKTFQDEIEFLTAIHDDVHIAVIDYSLKGEVNGLQVAVKLLEENPRCYVIIMSNQDDNKVIIEFMNAGAWKYVQKEGNYILEVVGFVQKAATLIKKDIEFYTSLIEKHNAIQCSK
ncbi:MAG TPA: response regulator [Flavisolibacter sp.]|nr:response regulator [Flavisolibacter sp.]